MQTKLNCLSELKSMTFSVHYYGGRDGTYANCFQCEFNVSCVSVSSVKFKKCF